MLSLNIYIFVVIVNIEVVFVACFNIFDVVETSGTIIYSVIREEKKMQKKNTKKRAYFFIS